jgi:ankyrin repeat protein
MVKVGVFKVKWPKSVAIIFLVLSSSYCQRTGYKLYPDVQLQPTSRKASFASKQTIEGLLYEIWESGFIRKNVLTKREILNNAYGIFQKAPKTMSDPEGRAFYQPRDGEKDLLMLNAKLFAHVEPAPKPPHPDKVSIKRLDRRIRATLVHELFHDFWHNILDERKRFLFAREVEIFFIELKLAKTEQQKRHLLDKMGIGQLENLDFESFEVLLEIQDIYSRDKLGTELYSTLAGRAYAGRTIIPEQFQKYYSFVVSDEFLAQGQTLSPARSGKREEISKVKKGEDLAELKISLDENPGLINSADTNGFTLLHHAAYSGNMDAVQFLVGKGADMNVRATACAWTPLFLASHMGHREIVTWFIENGAYAVGKDAKGRSLLHIAAQGGNKEIVELLLQQGARIGTEDAAGMTPLHMAALHGQQDTASFLIAKGADTKTKDSAGQIPFHLAAFCGNKNLAALLIAAGVELDDRDNNGESALHIASLCGQEHIVELLIAHGAKRDAQNKHGEIPEDLAAFAGHERIVAMLRGGAY